ncbi:hypothetical protein ACWEOE_40705 [Amycolatopsis sp. NPDC004368]
MKGKESPQAPAARTTYCALLMQASEVLRLRYVQCSQDTSLSPASAAQLASVFEGLANGHPDFDQIDPKEAIALAHRLIDDDHPELSGLWPRTL